MASQSDISSATTAVPSSPSSQPTATTQAASPPPQSKTDSSSSPSQAQTSPKPILPAEEQPNHPISATISNPTDPATMSPATTAAARSAILAHLSNVGSTSLAPMSQRAADIGAAHTSIAKQREDVEASTVKLGKESDRLAKEAEKADDVLKDIGNVDNWAQLLERDISVLEETLRIVDEEEGGEGEEGEMETDEEGRPVRRKRKDGKGKEGGGKGEGWLWGLWPGKSGC